MQHARPPAASISQQASSSSMSLSASPAAAKWKACTRRRCHTQSAPIQNSTNSLGSRGGVQSRSVCAPLQVANVQVAESRGSVREGHRGLGKEGKQAHLPVLFPPPSHQPSCPAHSPVVLQPPQPLHAQLLHLNALKADLSRCNSLSEKVNLLGSKPGVRAFLRANSAKPVLKCLPRLRLHEQYVLLCLPAMGQEHVLIQPSGTATARGGTSSVMAPLAELAALLMRVDQFYDSIGGLVGYQAKSIELILEGTGEQQPQQAQEEVSYHVPHALDLAGEGGREVGEQVAMQGLLALPDMAEIYPVGGAGDRLGLECEATGECLPAAMLPYGGRTMMEGLIRDLQAREHLYFRLTGKQVTTPVAIMTSDAKGNHRRMLELMESVDWFGRGKDSFRLFRQPLVPVISVEDGQWLLSDAMQLMAKPGGHGAIWKLMRDEGVFAWLQQQGRKAALVRQISNPMAGTDTTLLALAGRGQQQRSSFGFMSCDRAVGASEGCNALQERKRWEGGAWKYEYGYTNIEYTEFGRLGMSDQPTEHNSTTSKFPANTNVLYVNLDDALRVVEQAVTVGSSEQLMPGLIFNRNKAINYKDPLRGTPAQRMLAGRMECTMQNIADYMTDRKSEALQPTDPACNQLSTFLVYNERRKVTSSAKKRREQGSTKISQTPDGSFYDLQRNAWHLLQQCGVAAPPIVSVEQYLQNGPGFLFLFNPALGPLWDVVSQKIRGGELKPGAELVLEVAEASLEGVTVDGSLLVYADHALGHREATPASPTHASTAAALHRPWRHHSSSSSSSSNSSRVLNNISSSTSSLRSSSRGSSRSPSSSRSSSSSPTRSLPHTDVLGDAEASSPLQGSGSSSSSGNADPSTAAVGVPSLLSPPGSHTIHAHPLQHGHEDGSSICSNGTDGASSDDRAGRSGGQASEPMQLQPPPMRVADGMHSSAHTHAHTSQRLVYSSSSCGRLRLRNVTVANRGVDWGAPGNVYWKHQVVRAEALRVHLRGRSEFEAHDVMLQGNHTFEVPDGQRMVVSQGPEGSVQVQLFPLPDSRPTWHWAHRQDASGKLKLELVAAEP